MAGPTEVNVTLDFRPDEARGAVVAYAAVEGLMEPLEVASMSFWLLGDDPKGPAMTAFVAAVKAGLHDRVGRHRGQVTYERDGGEGG